MVSNKKLTLNNVFSRCNTHKPLITTTRTVLTLLALLSLHSFTPCHAQTPEHDKTQEQELQKRHKQKESTARTASLIPFIRENKNFFYLVGGTALFYLMIGVLKKMSSHIGRSSPTLSTPPTLGQPDSIPRIEPARPDIEEQAIATQASTPPGSSLALIPVHHRAMDQNALRRLQDLVATTLMVIYVLLFQQASSTLNSW